ncbi:hypothetical protein GPECTOR_3g467 [Gonium pectorale]|uniref:Uncharacterized protein n=1 Tax=Gonium pectorale TaxID=33097 RepID=A0A150GZU1_GONPE|nr:hypothetical protein GPECTOR_3g467 [Gonium pectorale]|eukprot:KXZ55335.1 hypothetical protein GPECTOR_3g467 [Gonium pectorale]
MAAAFVLPMRIYGKVVAPLTMYGVRLSPSLHVLLGPRVRPAPFSLRCLFRNHSVFDCAFFLSTLGVWRVNIYVEMAFCAFTSLTLGTLTVWYRDLVPGGLSLTWQLSLRALVLLTNLYLAAAYGRWSAASRGAAAAATTAAGATAGTSVAAGGAPGRVGGKSAKAIGGCGGSRTGEEDEEERQAVAKGDADGCGVLARHIPRWDLEVGAVLTALGLGEGPPGRAPPQVRTASVDALGAHDDTVVGAVASWVAAVRRGPDQVLTGAQAAAAAAAAFSAAGGARGASGGADGGLLLHRGTDLQPRAMLVQPAPPPHKEQAASAVLRVRLTLSAPAGPQGPLAAPPGLSALVRAAGANLPVEVLARGITPVQQHDGQQYGEYECEYEVRLLGAPSRPGPVLLELSLPPGADASAGLNRIMLPLLATHDPRVASELDAAAAEWPGEALEELNELVYDLATWAAAITTTTTTTAGADGGGGGDRFDREVLRVLGPHLLQFADDVGLVATAAWVRSGEDVGPADAPAEVPLTDTDADADAGAGQEVAAVSRRCSAADDDDDYAGMTALDGGGGGGRPLARGRGQRAVSPLGSLLLQALGLRPTPPAEEAAFQAFLDAWCVALGHTAHVVECLMLLAFLVRGVRVGQSLLSAEAAVAVVGLGMGTAMTLAWLVLPRPVWVRLVCAARVPRYCGYVVSKAMLAILRVRPPTGADVYAGGPGMLVLEGVILPGAFLVSPRTLLLVSLFKLPINAGAVHHIGAADSALGALFIAARVEVAALATTVACFVYLRALHGQRAAAMGLGAAGLRQELPGGGSAGAGGSASRREPSYDAADELKAKAKAE